MIYLEMNNEPDINPDPNRLVTFSSRAAGPLP